MTLTYSSIKFKAQDIKILELVAEGMTNEEIAIATGVTLASVKNRITEIYDKLGMWNRVELALWYISKREGL